MLCASLSFDTICINHCIYGMTNDPYFFYVSVQLSDQGLAAIASDADEAVGRQLAAFRGRLQNCLIVTF